MADNNSDSRTNLQESLKDQHKQGSLHPADLDMLMDSVSGKGYGQKRLNPAEQSSLSKKPAEEPEQRSLTGEKESRQIRGYINIVPMVITFALGILVSLLIFRMFSASSQGTKKRETIASNAVVEIPDPVLKKAIQDALGIGNREITGADALLLTELEYEGSEKEQIKDLTGLSEFKNLTELDLHFNQITDISALSKLTNLTYLNVYSNQVSDISALSGLTNLEELHLCSNLVDDISALSELINLTYLDVSLNQVSDISALSDLTNLTILYLGSNQIGDISALSGLIYLDVLGLSHNQVNNISALSELKRLSYLSLSDNPILENKSREEIMEVLSGTRGLYAVDF